MKNKFLLFFTIIAIIAGMLLLSTACGGGDGGNGLPFGGDPLPGSDPCADGHDFSAIVTTTASCTEAGEDAHKCTRCPYTVYTDAPALGHMAPGAVPATCTTAGNSGAGICERCGVGDAGSPIPALGHDHFQSLVCTRSGCGHQYALGDPGPGGGFIFYVADGGGTPARTPFTLYMNATDTVGITAHYLEAAPADISGVRQWASRMGDPIPGLSQGGGDQPDRAIGRGRKNTAIIIAYGQNPTNPPSSSTTPFITPAASACVTYGSPNDWFLPSRNELAELYKLHAAVRDVGSYPGLTTGLIDSRYWSSSQENINYPYSQDFFNGSQSRTSGFNKIGTSNVRAVRAF